MKYVRKYRTRASNNRGYYYFFILSDVGLSLMFGGIPLKSRGYDLSAVIIQERLLLERVRYVCTYLGSQPGSLLTALCTTVSLA